jgi:hypothetical protein
MQLFKLIFDKDLAFTSCSNEKSTRMEDDEVGANCSLFSKMLHQDKNDKGGLYQFDDNQLEYLDSLKINNKNNPQIYWGFYFLKITIILFGY